MNSKENKDHNWDFDKMLETKINQIQKDLTHGIAMWVKYIRMDKESGKHYWEDIATQFIEKYPEFAHRYELQIDNSVSGIIICEGSRLYLKEELNDWS
jgi:hypothetical protein